MNKENTYFTIEPFVYISLKKRGVFLYNTLNQKILESNYPPVVSLVKKLNRGNRLQVVKLNLERVNKDQKVKQFLDKTRAYFLGDFIHSPGDVIKPVQLVPMTGLLKDTDGTKSGYSFTGEGMTYLRALTLFINSSCDQDCRMCRDAYKQFPCCRQSGSTPAELDIDSIKNLLNEAGDFLTRIDISGGNILKYSKFTELTGLLKDLPATKTLYIHYLNLTGRAAVFNGLDRSFVLNILVNFPADREKLKDLLRHVQKDNLNFKVVFIPQSENELIKAQNVLETSGIDRFSFSPYFNGRNINFFKKYVFIKKKSLLNSKPSIKDIHARKTINHNCFGHLFVLTNGRVYANLNAFSLGNISTTSIRQMVFKELQKKNQWLKTRDKVKPCRECHYHSLCPSISNYEYAVGKNNLCTIYKENSHGFAR